MERLNNLLQANIEASENLVRTEACAGAEGRRKSERVSYSTKRMLEFKTISIKEKGADLVCPMSRDRRGADLHVPGAAPDLLHLPTKGEGVSSVQSGLQGAVQETQIRRENC